MTATTLKTDALTKRYDATVALDGVTLSLREGEVHAVLGENGAGKSTLVKLLSGVVAQNSGEMELCSRPYAPASIKGARMAGVSTSFQELSLIPNMSVGENLLLPRASNRAFWPDSRQAIMRSAAQILADWDVSDIAPEAIIEDLSLAERQRIEITRALSHAAHLLILDEPTAALPDPEWLFQQIRRVTANGVAVMYISHRLGEVRTICQRATVLRNGATIKTVDLEGVSDDDIFSMMVGRSPDRAFGHTAEVPEASPTILEVSGLCVVRNAPLDITLRAGEIVGLAGLDGQGQKELFQTLGGVTRPAAGQVRIGGALADLSSPRGALGSGVGIAFVPEERKTEGIFANLTSATNIALPKISEQSRAGFVTSGIESAAAAEAAQKVALAPRYMGFPVGNLSGGNQQKVLLARALMTGAKCLILFDPARGVDVGTKQAIYAMMRDFVAKDGAILFYSSELTELVHLSTRCLAIYDGRITADILRADLTEERLLVAAHGQDWQDHKMVG